MQNDDLPSEPLMSYSQIKKIQEALQVMGMAGEIEKTGYGHQVSFKPHVDSKNRELKVTLSYVKGLFEKVPALKTDVTHSVTVWQLQFVYPFKTDPSRTIEALKLVNSINPRLAMPGFYLNEDESCIAFNYCLIAQCGEDPHHLLMDVVGCAVNQYEHFLPEFEALSQPGWARGVAHS
jgi:hypothetical protein